MTSSSNVVLKTVNVVVLNAKAHHSLDFTYHILGQSYKAQIIELSFVVLMCQNLK